MSGEWESKGEEMDKVGRRVRVYWESEGDWFTGSIENYEEEKGYFIVYDDGDEEWAATLEGVEFEDEGEGGGEENGECEENYENEYEEVADRVDDLELEEGYVGETQEHETEHLDYDKSNLRSLSISPVSSPKRSARSERERDHVNVSRQSIHSQDERSNKEPSGAESSDLDFQSSLHSTKELRTNGVLLKGEILGANNLPPGNDDQNAAGVFYRVLYAEGGDESSMFRCKTPIYKSQVALDIEFPRWENDKKFRFEMVLPGDETLDESDFTDHGDIIIAIYKSRANGGSDFIGQVCIQLQDFIRVGSVGRARPHSHCRLLKGCFPLIDRHGDIVSGGTADVDIDISLEWRLVDKPPQSLKSRSAIEEITSRNKKLINNGDKKPKKGGARNTSNAMSALKASKKNRRQAFLDAENEKIRNRLERAGPKQAKRPVGASHKASDNTTVRDIYKPSAASDRKKAASRKSNESKGISKKRPASSVVSKPLSTYLSHDELVAEYEALKKKVGDIKLELSSLHTMDSKLKAQVVKNEAVTARMKKNELSSRKKANKENFSKSQEDKKQSESFYSVKNILLRAGIEDDEDQLSDELLRERLAEHSYLQETRIACLERVEKAKQRFMKDELSAKHCKSEIDQKHRELEARASKLDKPKNDWNLHVMNKESKLSSLKTEVLELDMIRKHNLEPELGKCFNY